MNRHRFNNTTSKNYQSQNSAKDQIIFYFMKFRKYKEGKNIICRTEPDRIIDKTMRISRGEEAKQKLREISCTNSSEYQDRSDDDWGNQKAPKQKRVEKCKELQQGCFNVNLRKIQTKTIPLHKTILTHKNRSVERQSQFQRTLRSMKDGQNRKKSCVSINLQFQKQAENTEIRIHSSSLAITQLSKQRDKIFKKSAIDFMTLLSRNKAQNSTINNKYKFYKRYDKKQRIQNEMMFIRKKHHERKHNLIIINKSQTAYMTKQATYEQSPYRKDFKKIHSIINSERRNISYIIK